MLAGNTGGVFVQDPIKTVDQNIPISHHCEIMLFNFGFSSSEHQV